MINFILHITGIDTQQSPWYDFWSGIATQGSLVIMAASYYMKHNCHKHGCLRIGKHTYAGTPYCTKHHPKLRSKA